ncbi:Multicopper oxidase [Mycena sanguinolenta]|uniref:Multicopper oxidase n=1 Tax=Mycena sanguinolenta TaxID=230812 RepID=A0A8H7CG62_9AGAR|nr:Multicopper oxidase [Mycena sanguinolenta]
MTRLSASFLSIALVVATLASAATVGPVGDILVANASVTLDGTTRPAVLSGGQFPGTTIIGNKGDRFQLNVVNNQFDPRMLQSTSIHWHGIFQNGTASYDGAAFITQCPIAHGNSFLYDFTVNQAGTFWYHSHLSTQYCDGLRGPMVVYDPQDPYLGYYDVDDESTVLTLADWYHTLAKQATGTPAPDSTLIQGLGRTATTLTAPLGVLTVQQGLRYRIRLINIACSPNYVFQIDGHTNLTIIEADGITTKPYTVDQITIFAGQRYSFILNANQAVGNYCALKISCPYVCAELMVTSIGIRANPSAGTKGFAGGINSAILRYVGAANADPTSTQDVSTNAFVEANMRPLDSPGAPLTPVSSGTPAKSFNFAISVVGIFPRLPFAHGTSSHTACTLAGERQIRDERRLLRPTYHPSAAADSFRSGGRTIASPHRLRIPPSQGQRHPGVDPRRRTGPSLSLTALKHPFHLHGHAFDVVRSAGSSVYNYVDPPRRDVVSTGNAGDNVTIRFVTNNDGPAWDDLCPAYNALSASDL